MKKVYTKPLAVIENFELSQHIAACQNIMVANSAIRDGCDADPKPGSGSIASPNLFYTDLAKDCTVDGEDMYCYTTGGTSTFVFTS